MESLTAEQLAEYHDDLSSHMIAVNIYTPLCLFYELSHQVNKAEIIDKLTHGLKKLSASFPWLTSQVIRPELGVTRLTSHGETCRLIVKDYNGDPSVPSMSSFRTAGFPLSMIDGETFTSLTGVPNARDGEAMPVFFVQASFITGGLVLSFASEHSTMDGHGTGQLIRLLSKACEGEEFTTEELREGNRVRKGVIPLLDESAYKPGVELDYLVDRPERSANNVESNPPPKCTWAVVGFSSSHLSKLKSLAEAAGADDSDAPKVPYITSNDALTAFIWQSTSRARVPRLPADATSTVGRAVDARGALSISPSYLGNVSNHAYTTLPLRTIASSSLKALATGLRSALRPADIAHGIRSLATYLSQAADRSTIHYGANLDFSRDLFVSSWARLPCYQHEFSLGLGPPEAVRRPGFLEIEGLMYLLPMKRQGGIDAMICLRDEDMSRLRADTSFSEFSSWIG